MIYRPPKIAFTKDSDLTDKLKEYSRSYSHKIIMGDLNADLLTDDADAKFVRKLADDLAVQVVYHGATHHTPETDSHTWIDTIMVDSNDKILKSSNDFAPWSSKHNIISVIVDIAPLEPEISDFYYREYNKIEGSDLVHLLGQCDWSLLCSDNPLVDEAVRQLTTNITGAIDQLAPLKKATPKSNRPPWVDAELLRLYKKRDAVLRRYHSRLDPFFLAEFQRLRDEAAHRTTAARAQYLHNKLYAALGTNNIWNELRNLGLLPKKKEDLNGFTPDELNAHFASISVSQDENPSAISDIINSASNDGFKFKKIDINDVILAISHFSSKAIGEDGIPQSVVLKVLSLGLEVCTCYSTQKMFDTFIYDGLSAYSHT